MVLLINRREVEGAISIELAIDSIEKAFRELHSNPGINLTRRRLHVNDGNGREVASQAMLSSFVGALPSLGYIGSNTRCDFHKNFSDHVDSVSPFRYDRNVFVLYNLKDASPLAIIYGGSDKSSPISERSKNVSVPLRTAACVALGTKYLARADSETLGFFGAGFYAPIVMNAVYHSVRVKRARVYSPTRQRRENFCSEISKLLGLDVTPVDEPSKAVKDCDLVVTCTSSRDPVFNGDWLEKGTHVTTMVGANRAGYGFGRREIDDETYKRASFIAITNKEQAIVDDEANITDAINHGVISWGDVHELHELASGQVKGRSASDQITVFNNNGGQGVAELAIAVEVYESARRLGLGKELEY